VIKHHGRRLINRFYRPFRLRILGTITSVQTKEPVAALTFDDGPHPEYTPQLLKTLDKHGARATFFMVGEAAQRHQDLVKMVSQAGHAIGVHSWDHSSFPTISAQERRRQLRACIRALGQYIGPYGKRLFRPPWGQQSVASRLDALLLGYKVVTWNVVAEDWLPLKPKDMADRLMQSVKPGSIVLLHDAIYRSIFARPQYDRSAMIEALDMSLQLTDNKMRFITIPELLQHGRPALCEWFYHKS